MRLLFVTCLIAALVGCSRSEPWLAGGKPVAHWVKALQDPDAGQRRLAARKLGNVGPADETILPALLKALQDKDEQVRGEVILALVKFGPAARDAIPALRTLQDRDEDPHVRTYAARALGKIQAE
jgi:HEAT repeat protein